MNNKTLLISAVLLLLLGYAIGRHLQPAEVKERIVVKEVESTKKNVVIVEKEITKPDGTIVKEKITTDKTTIDKSVVSDKRKEISSRNLWLASVGVSSDFSLSQPTYNVSIQRRFLGPILLGGSYSTNGQIGVVASLEF